MLLQLRASSCTCTIVAAILIMSALRSLASVAIIRCMGAHCGYSWQHSDHCYNYARSIARVQDLVGLTQDNAHQPAIAFLRTHLHPESPKSDGHLILQTLEYLNTELIGAGR